VTSLSIKERRGRGGRGGGGGGGEGRGKQKNSVGVSLFTDGLVNQGRIQAARESSLVLRKKKLKTSSHVDTGGT